MKIRKIISAEQEEKKRKRNQLILGVFLVFIMIFSTLGYSFQSGTGGGTVQNPANNQTENYNGFEFFQKNGFWVLNENGTNFVFVYNPAQVERINANINLVGGYKNKTLYLKSDSIEASSEIRVNLGQLAAKIDDLQNQTCDDNSITIKEGNESKISQNKNCVTIEGKTGDIVKITDEFLFKILGITN